MKVINVGADLSKSNQRSTKNNSEPSFGISAGWLEEQLVWRMVNIQQLPKKEQTALKKAVDKIRQHYLDVHATLGGVVTIRTKSTSGDTVLHSFKHTGSFIGDVIVAAKDLVKYDKLIVQLQKVQKRVKYDVSQTSAALREFDANSFHSFMGDANKVKPETTRAILEKRHIAAVKQNNDLLNARNNQSEFFNA